MAQKTVSVSEARRQFSRLIRRVSKRRTAVTITQHGKEQATLIGMDEYRELTERARVSDRSDKAKQSFTVRGSLELCCTPEELMHEISEIRSQWRKSIERSSKELARELGRK